MSYNMTSIWESNNIFELVGAVNTASSGWFIAFFMMILFFAIMIIYNKDNFKTVFIVDSFLITIIGIFVFIMGWVGSTTVLIVPMLMLFMSIIIYLVN